MAEFTLHVRLVADQAAAEDGERLLSPYVEEYESVSFGSDQVEQTSPEAIVPDRATLEIGNLDDFADIYTELRTTELVHDLSLWGPSSERFPVPVQHYALQQIQRPDMYQYHALDEQVTLVVAESEMAAEQVRREVPDGALGYSQSPF